MGLDTIFGMIAIIGGVYVRFTQTTKVMLIVTISYVVGVSFGYWIR